MFQQRVARVCQAKTAGLKTSVFASMKKREEQMSFVKGLLKEQMSFVKGLLKEHKVSFQDNTVEKCVEFLTEEFNRHGVDEGDRSTSLGRPSFVGRN
jgi:hypothetical protein